MDMLIFAVGILIGIECGKAFSFWKWWRYDRVWNIVRRYCCWIWCLLRFVACRCTHTQFIKNIF